ncbi:MAG: UDP-3-O-(3-hydroxymyristoyl)glucosamine N-acyltransferase [Planctomycetaceae bacterium]|nr:UDP-3-O-(3-hydroxymyristoyl)glucosamine N-acyltransferase [Planctomycetaceae bacterium]
MAFRLAQLAELTGGRLVGDGEAWITGAAVLGDAKPHEITLVDHADRLPKLGTSLAAAAVVPRGLPAAPIATIEVDDVHQAFAAIVQHFRPARQRLRRGVSPAAFVSPSARIESDVEIQAGAFVGDDAVIESGATIHSGARVMAGCRIGAKATIYPNAVLYEDTVIGPRAIVHAGVVLGADGFGYKFVAGRHQQSAQLGNVQIGADVEIGANTTIDRGTYGPTVIGEGTKIDNQVQIGHNCRLGRHNLICSQVGIAGSTSTGDYVVMAGQCGVRDHVHIGTGAILAAMSGISNDVPEGARMMGIPATPEREQKLKQASFAKLPEMRRQLRALERLVAALVPETHPLPQEDRPGETNAAA